MKEQQKCKEIALGEELDEQGFINLLNSIYKENCYIYAIVPQWEKELLESIKDNVLYKKELTSSRLNFFARETSSLVCVDDADKKHVYDFYLRSTTLDNIVYSNEDMTESLQELHSKKIDLYELFKETDIPHVTIGHDGQWLSVYAGSTNLFVETEADTMKNWLPLTSIEHDRVWKRVYKELKFNPSISKFPSFKVKAPFITYDVSAYLANSEDLKVYDDLDEKVLSVFKGLTKMDEYILALDWQHECYQFNPHLPFKKDEFGEWPVPPFPNGDYYFFLEKDFKWGYLGHPWEETITIFGEELLNAFHKSQPTMFQKVLRKS